MTEQEARNECMRYCLMGMKMSPNAKDIMIGVLKKHIPIKTIRVKVGNTDETDGCPICKHEFYEKHNFCPQCGQAIEWKVVVK